MVLLTNLIFLREVEEQVTKYLDLNQCQLVFHFLKKFCFSFVKNNTIYCISVSVIGIGRYEKYHIGILSVSADMKIGFIGDYRYRPIWKNPYRSYTGSI